ncbi:MAG: glycoside hydrolase family 30 beta sandwich domain-containing protein [Candidatus Acidiferrum sp.]
MKLRCALFCVLGFSVSLSITANAQRRGDVQLWLTTLDRSALFAPQSLDLHFANVTNQLPTIDVQDNQRLQSIDGFGFALTGGSAELLMLMTPAARSALLSELFSTEGTGIGVSYLRISIGSSDMNDHVFSYDDMPAGDTDVDLKKFNLDPDRTDLIPILREILAIDPKIRILGSPWSPPPWMKTNDDSKGGSLKPEYYGVYAQYFVKYIKEMKVAGVSIDAITVQNEPLNPKNNPSMTMFSDEEDAFIRDDLGPAFQKAGISTKILLYDHNPDVPSYPLSILKDPIASKYVDGTAFHLYGGETSALTMVHDAFPDKNLYLTEQSVTESHSAGGINIAEPVSGVLIAATRNWSKNVILWNLAADPNDGPHTIGGCPVCRGAITLAGDHASRLVAYYALAHFSKFVRPGSVRLGSNDLEQLANVAFRTPDGKVVLVASNTGNYSKTFNIEYQGKIVTTTLTPGAVGSYVW